MPAVASQPKDVSGFTAAGLMDNEMGSASSVLRESSGGQEEVGVSFLTDEKVTQGRKQNCLIIWLSSPHLALL